MKEVVKPLPEWGPALPENRTGRYEEESPLTPSVLSTGIYNFAFTTKTLGLPLAIKPHIFIPTPLSRSRTSVYIGGSRVDLRGSMKDLMPESKQGSRAGSKLDLRPELRASAPDLTTDQLSTLNDRIPLGLPQPQIPTAPGSSPPQGIPTIVTTEMQPMGNDRNNHTVAISPLAIESHNGNNESNV